MPILDSAYSTGGLFKNGHVSTIYSAKLRRVSAPPFKRERINLPDNDFLDLDWSFTKQKSEDVIIMLHGLEGNAQRSYMMGCTNYAMQMGWNVANLNFRGCSGTPNLKYYSYNAGKTDDLEVVINHIVNKNKYQRIALVGYSLGGNMLLKYLGDGSPGASHIYKGVAISAPLHLKGSLARLEERQNWVYRTTFLSSMKRKLIKKQQEFPDKIKPQDIKNIKSILDFDNSYTAPAHGFKDAFDYYKFASSVFYLENVKTPALVLSAQNDSFLSKQCYPYELAKASPYIYLETPLYGGHVGFVAAKNLYYNEYKTLSFLNDA